MFLKITVIAIVAFFAITDGADQVWNGYSAKWAVNASDGFFRLPTNMTDAVETGWNRISATKTPPGVVVLALRGDLSLTLLFSKRTKQVVGHQVALLVANIKKSRVPFAYDDKPGFTRRRLNGRDHYTALSMFKDDAVEGRRIWLEINGEFEEIPTKYDQVISETRYYSKQCFKWMGNHFYQVNSTTSISDFFPWFLLSVGDDIIGMGVQAIGKASFTGKETWFEDIDAAQTAGVIPDVSTEVDEGIKKYGLYSVHIYFRKNPVEILCRDKCTAVYNGTEESSGGRAIRKRRALGEGNVC